MPVCNISIYYMAHTQKSYIDRNLTRSSRREKGLPSADETRRPMRNNSYILIFYKYINSNIILLLLHTIIWFKT
jgi:hypothetical protein